MAEFHLARFEAALTLVDEDGLPAAGVHDRALRNGHDRHAAAGVDFRVDIHVVQQHEVRILQFDANTRRPRLLVDLGIDHVDLPGELAPGKAAGPHRRRLADGDRAEIAFRDVDQRPDHRMIGDPEQHAAGLNAHALDRAALQHNAVARRRPFDRGRNVPALFDGRDRRIGHVEVHQSLPRSAAVRDVAAGRLRRDGGDVLGGRRRYGRAVDLHQGLALDDVRTGRDVGDFQDKAFRPHRDHGYPPLVELYRAGRADHRADHPLGRRLGLHAGALDLSGRQFHRAVVGIVALVDGDVIHPHGILLRHGDVSGSPIGLR